MSANNYLLLNGVADSLQKPLRPEVPVLCYHQIDATEKKEAASITVSAAAFEQQMKVLYDSGYRAILPGDLYAYLNGKMTFPFKPVMITFDDGTEGQYAYALKTLDKYHFKATWFIMTVSIDRPGFLTKKQIRELANQGHIIGNHTWDHHNVKTYQAADWKIQLDDPAKTLQAITGKSVTCFAYPYGSSTRESINALRERGYVLAFILETKKDEHYPMFTVRRIMANRNWTPASLLKSIHQYFH